MGGRHLQAAGKLTTAAVKRGIRRASRRRGFLLLASAPFVLLAGCATTTRAQNEAATAVPTVPGLRGSALAEARNRVASRDPGVSAAYSKLIRQADSVLRVPLISVTHKKTLLPPTNDPHDYFSLSPYWWPDPSKSDGLPYIRRDGETNPESKRDLDQPRVAALGFGLQTLGLAYYFTREEKYAARAAEQLRYWFLDSATRMNPHLRFAQLVRGNPNERGSGIIDTRWFIEAVQAASLIEGSRSWTADDAMGLRYWFGGYLKWLLESPNGAHERRAVNNHGSWYAAQTAAYALYLGDTARARAIVDSAKSRIGKQITADGQQPIELERTRSMHYAGFNIEALSRLAEIGRALGADLWSYRSAEGGSIRGAIDHVAKHVGTGVKWPGQQIDEVEPALLLIHVRRAAATYESAAYKAALGRFPRDLVMSDRSALLYPDPR